MENIGQFSAIVSYINGQNYTHHVAFQLAALVKHGRPKAAIDALKRLLPDNTETVKASGERGEPFGFTNCYLSDKSARPGEGQDSWATGGASWLHFVFTEWMMGAVPDYKGLKISPVIPKGWKRCSIRRRFRDAVYEIAIKNPSGRSTGKVASITVDGKAVRGAVLPDFRDGKTHKVSVVMK